MNKKAFFIITLVNNLRKSMKNKQKAIAIPLIVFLINRASLFLIVYLGLLFYPPRQGPGLWRAFPHNLFLDGWVRWDSGWYLSIVSHGYSYLPDQQSNVVFFLFIHW